MNTTDAIEAEYQESGSALAVAQPAKAAVANWTPRFVMPIEEMVQASDDMTEFQRRIMVKEIHYGTIPGTDKPTLLKPGAELLLSRMGLHAADPTILSETIDYGDCDAEGTVTREGLIRFSLQVNIYHQTGLLENERVLVGSGIGAATSREKKYRWRDGSPTCPTCGKGLRMSKNNPEWYCWAKMGGCSATFPKADFQQVGKVPNPELGDLENTIFKMSKKRALIDATLVATGCSNVFTQDVGDDTDPNGDPDPNDLADAAAAAQGGRRSQGADPKAATKEQHAEVQALSKSLGLKIVPWVNANVVPGFAERPRPTLNVAEYVKVKAALETLIPKPVDEPQTDVGGTRRPPPPKPAAPPTGPEDAAKMTPRTQGRLFALLDERLSTDKEARLIFAAEHGVEVDSFSKLTELQARTLIRQLEMLKPPNVVEDEMVDDALEAYAEGRIL